MALRVSSQPKINSVAIGGEADMPRPPAPYRSDANDPMRPSRQSAPRLIADATAALASPCRPQTISCRDGIHLLGGGLPGLMDSIRRCRTGG